MCEPWFCVGLGWLPISVGVMLASTMVIPYCIATALDHVPAGFPYISDTGTLPPESCVFGQLLNLTAAFALATMYVRYKQVREYSGDIPRVHQLNKLAFILGGLAALGMSLVANFQETNMLWVHVTGAGMCFGIGILYGFVQSWISFKMRPHHSTLFVCRMRLCLSSLGFLFLISTFLFTSISLNTHKKEGKRPLKWKPDDNGFAFHIIATGSEWCVAIAFLGFFFTFIREFQKLAIVAEIRGPQYISSPGDNSASLLT